MDTIQNNAFTFVFGNKNLSCSAETMLQKTTLARLNVHDKLFIKTQQLFATKTLILPRQTHGTGALIITTPHELHQALQTIIEADIVITTLPHIAIGVLTADCLPLLLVDPTSHAIAAVHAGWRGTVANIAGKAIHLFKEVAGSNSRNIQAYLGPCAHVESYPASPELINALENCPVKTAVLKNYGGEVHFDIPQLNIHYLEEAGVPHKNIHKNHSVDTIIDQRYWSYRRDGEKAGRQLSAVCLNKGVS